MRSKAKFLSVLPLLCAFLWGGIAFAGETAPEFSLRDINGKAVRLSDYKGKVVLVNFWATWSDRLCVMLPLANFSRNTDVNCSDRIYYAENIFQILCSINS